MLEKASVVTDMHKLLIFKDSVLRTRPFVRPRGAEKGRVKTRVKGQKWAQPQVAKSASRREKPRQPWDVAGLIDMPREYLCKFYWWTI